MLNLPFVIQNVDNQLFLKAIFALAVYAFLRIGEITTKNNLDGSKVLQVSNVSFNDEDKDINGLSVVITNYKHSDLHAKSIFIPLEIGNAACPVKAVHNYLSTFGHTKGSFFQFRCGSPVTHYYFPLR
jgi:sporulation protein YlmC with PRC-barrel domain